MTNVPSNRDAASLLVNGTSSVVESEGLKALAGLIAGRSPDCACPGAAGICARQISPFFIGFHLFRETFDHFDGAGARALPAVELFLQIRRHFRSNRLQADFNTGPFGQRRIGNDDAVRHDAGDGAGRESSLP